MTETLEQLVVRLLAAVPVEKRNAFLDWAISGMPIRSEAEKQEIIQNIKEVNRWM